MEQIDRASPIPYYAQVKDVLRKRIEARFWKPGDALPSEPELCQIFDVSRTVIRQALTQMMYEGLVLRQKGKGTFVAEPKVDYGLSTLISFSKMMQSRGHEVTTRILDQQVITPLARVAQALRLGPGSEVVLIRRLRLVNNMPAAIHVTYLDAPRFAYLLHEDLANQSLWDVLERVSGVGAGRVRDFVEAKPLAKEDAELLQQNVDAPALLVEGVAFDTSDRPLLYTRALNRGDRFRFAAESGISFYLGEEEKEALWRDKFIGSLL